MRALPTSVGTLACALLVACQNGSHLRLLAPDAGEADAPGAELPRAHDASERDAAGDSAPDAGGDPGMDATGPDAAGLDARITPPPDSAIDDAQGLADSQAPVDSQVLVDSQSPVDSQVLVDSQVPVDSEVVADAGDATVEVPFCGRVRCDCTLDGIPLWGDVEVVSNFADFKVRRVTAFGDLYVKETPFPNDCGEWRTVSSFGDFTVQWVDAFEDFSIEYRTFPGLPP